MLSCQSGMTPIITFGLILGLSFFNKLDMNPTQVTVSSVSKSIELRIMSEAWSSQVCYLTWRHPFCHDVDAQEVQTLGGQHIYLPVKRLGWCMRYMLMIVQMLQNKLMYSFIERDMVQWLERGALTMWLPVVWFRIRLGARFSEKNHVSPLSI